MPGGCQRQTYRPALAARHQRGQAFVRALTIVRSDLGHKLVVDAIEEGDAQAARANMRKHLSNTIDRIPALARENPQYFT